MSEDTASNSAPSVIDIEAMLQPIEGENPAGESLQYSGLYDEIREARRADDKFAQGDWQSDIKVADWRQVISLAVPALTTRTKDLQIGGWLAEGLAKNHGFVGARDSFRLMQGLHERFWDYLYPEIDEGDMEARGNALAFMDAKVSDALKEIPLTNSSSQNYGYIQWEESREFDIPENVDSLSGDQQEKWAAKKQQAESEGKVTGEAWRKAYNSSRRAFYEDTLTTLNECWAAYQGLDRIMDERFGNQTPGLGELRKTLDALKTLIERLVKEKRIAEPYPSELAGEAGEEGGEGLVAYEGGGVGIGSGPVRSRQEALKRLGEVAEYFRRTEPHSPVSYLVARAAKWGQMDLNSWLAEVIKDEGALGQLRELLGINPYSGGEESGGDGY
jgi:type VI secretion system protein ImpA